jgi:signal peptidase
MRPMSLLRTLTRRSLDLVLVALFVLSASLLAAGWLLPNLGRQLVIIDGGSMAPTIPNGSAVIVGTHPADVRVGDVVTIRIPSSGVLFTHRVVSIETDAAGTALRTKGDANADPDATPSPSSWVVGRVDASVPGLGYAAAALQSGTGRAALITLLIVVLALRWFGDDSDEAATSTSARGPKGAARGRGLA